MSVNLSIFRLGIVDFGTVAIRLDIYELSEAKPPELCAKYRALPRLGEVLHDSPRFLSRVMHELREVQKKAESEAVDELLVVGTMAMRKAAGAEEMLERVKTELGISIRVLTGEEEAQLTARGILAFEKNLPDSLAFVDIGGGSTEVSFYNQGRVQESKSYNVGVLTAESGVLLPEELADSAKTFQPTLVIGSSGTIRAIEKLLLSHGEETRSYQASELHSLSKKLRGLSFEEMLQVPGVEKSRADILLPGLKLFSEVLGQLQVSEFRVSHFSLRHGLLDEWVKGNRSKLSA